MWKKRNGCIVLVGKEEGKKCWEDVAVVTKIV
jgi:hypothetical protein